MSTAAETLEIKRQQLAEVRQAITAVLTRGQSYQIMDGGAMRQLNRGNLRQLQDMQSRLELEVSRLERGGIGVNYGMPC